MDWTVGSLTVASKRKEPYTVIIKVFTYEYRGFEHDKGKKCTRIMANLKSLSVKLDFVIAWEVETILASFLPIYHFGDFHCIIIFGIVSVVRLYEMFVCRSYVCDSCRFVIRS